MLLVRMTLAMPHGLANDIVTFTLRCPNDVRIIERQTFEIVFPDVGSVKGVPVAGHITNRSDAVVIVYMIGDHHHHSFDEAIARLRRMTGAVSDIVVSPATSVW